MECAAIRGFTATFRASQILQLRCRLETVHRFYLFPVHHEAVVALLEKTLGDAAIVSEKDGERESIGIGAEACTTACEQLLASFQNPGSFRPLCRRLLMQKYFFNECFM